MGISTGEKKLDFLQTMLCIRCGQFGRFEVYMTYTCFSLFFIPLFKWNKQFRVRSTCCNAVYNLDPSLGHRIAGGEQVILREEDLSSYAGGSKTSTGPHCPNCGYPSEEGFRFCPKCGGRL